MIESTVEITLAEKLILDAASFVDDPLGFVYFAFSWGEGVLEDHEGPDEWQREVLKELKAAICSGDTEAFQVAIASGHGTLPRSCEATACGRGASGEVPCPHAVRNRTTRSAA